MVYAHDALRETAIETVVGYEALIAFFATAIDRTLMHHLFNQSQQNVFQFCASGSRRHYADEVRKGDTVISITLGVLDHLGPFSKTKQRQIAFGLISKVNERLITYPNRKLPCKSEGPFETCVSANGGVKFGLRLEQDD